MCWLAIWSQPGMQWALTTSRTRTLCPARAGPQRRTGSEVGEPATDSSPASVFSVIGTSARKTEARRDS